MLMLEYLRNNGMSVTLKAIDKPDKEIKSFEDPLKFGLEHEIYVTSLIHNIYAECVKENDFRTMQFLDWFVKEQGEEEDTAGDKSQEVPVIRLRARKDSMHWMQSLARESIPHLL